MRRGARVGFEIKLSESPAVTKSMRIAVSDLGLARLAVVFPGSQSFPLGDKIEAVAARDLPGYLATI
jgi:hypothetical protein